MAKDGPLFNIQGGMVMFNKVRVALGKGFLDKFTIFEWKQVFSIYFHIFNTIEQDRFHTHAFGGIAFVFKGGYEEEYKSNNGEIKRKWVGFGVRYIPSTYNHRLLRSKSNSMSILFTGPWNYYWTEEKIGLWIRVLTWGRKEISRFPSPEAQLKKRNST